MNPRDANARGIADGEIIRLFNARGACLATVRVTEAIAPGIVRLSETKNDDARSVPVPVELGKELLALVRSKALPAHDDFYKALKRAVALLGYDARLCVYSMRHTGYTRAARKNAGAKVQKFAEHRDYRTTQNYIHLEDEDMADVAMTLQEAG